MAVQTPPFISFNGPQTLFSQNSVTNPEPINLPTLDMSTANGGVITTGSPMFPTNTTASPINVNGPFDYMQSGNAPLTTGVFPDFGKPSSIADTTISYNPPDGPVGDAPITGTKFPTLVGPNTNTGGSNLGGGGGSGGGSTGPAPIPQVLISQDISQRTPSGTIYAPDLSAYNDSSLFNYTGPGGVDEYTYGQGLRMGGDYNAFGSPTDMANPYYEGQFAPLPTSPADSAITMPAVQLPGGLPQIENNTPIAAIGGGSGTTQQDPTYQQTINEMGIFGPDNPPPSTTFPSPGGTEVASPSSQANAGLTQSMAGSDEEYQEMLTASLNMDNQLMNQLDSSDPRGGENELNKDAVKVSSSGMDSGLLTPENETGIGSAEQSLRAPLGTANPQGGMPNPYRDRDGVDYSPQVTDTGSTNGFTDTADDRFKPAGAPDAQLIRKVGAGMADGLATAMQKGQELQDQFGNADAINTVGSPNQFEIQRAEADANQAALDKERYNTQINNPTADFSGYMKNYGDGGNFTDPPYLGRGEEVKNIFDEQQNYEVPASEMSPGETGLVNGIVEGLKSFGPNDERSMGEQKAWDRYGDYKSAGAEALNKGEIDEKAFNEIKGKAGSETVINHFVDSSKNPKTNNFMTNASNIFYQAMDVIVGDDSIKDGIVDYYQQKKGVNSTDPLGSVAEEIAKAKEATAQRKEVQENIFTPGPMKFAAAAKPKPVVVKKVVATPPRISVNYNTNTPAPTQKKQSRAGAGSVKAPTRSTGSRGTGGYSRPASSSPSRSVGYSAYRRGNR